jgi:DNA-binding HxlR family transcriptional regulator
MMSEEQAGSEGARNLRIEREIECLWVIRNDEYATVESALAWASTQEGWACEGIKVSTLRKRLRELELSGHIEWADKKRTSAKLTALGEARLQAYLEKARSANKWVAARRNLAVFSGKRGRGTGQRGR